MRDAIYPPDATTCPSYVVVIVDFICDVDVFFVDLGKLATPVLTSITYCETFAINRRLLAINFFLDIPADLAKYC